MKTSLRLWAMAAALLVAPQGNAAGLGLDLAFASQYQDLPQDSAQLSAFSIAPYYSLGQWEFSAALPYSHIEGTYFRNDVRPWVQNVCTRLLSLDARQQQLLIRRGRITQERLDQCREIGTSGETYSDTTQGMGDATLSLRYALDLNQAQTWVGFVGLGYSHDNGDYAEGLGKGSRDTEINAGLLHSIGAASFSLTGRYTLVNPTAAQDDIQDYASASFAADYAFTDYVSLGGDYGFEESYFAELNDVETLTLFIDLRFGEHWSAHLLASRYLNREDFAPQHEYGLVLRYSLR